MMEKADFNQAFGQRVKDARRDRNMRAEATAEAAGISPQFLSDVERGKKSMGSYNVARLATALGVTTDYLIFGREDANKSRELLAEHLATLTPATRDMALHALSTMMGIMKAYVPAE